MIIQILLFDDAATVIWSYLHKGGVGGEVTFSEIFLTFEGLTEECSRILQRSFPVSVAVYDNTSSLLQLRISLGLNNESSKPHNQQHKSIYNNLFVCYLNKFLLAVISQGKLYRYPDLLPSCGFALSGAKCMPLILQGEKISFSLMFLMN
jgi:hypothetical protein